MNIDEREKLIEDTTEKVVKAVGTLTRPRKIASFIEILISIAISIGLNLVYIKLDFEAVRTGGFWVSTLFTLIAVILIFRSVINFSFDSVSQRPSVIAAKEEYEKLNKDKDLDLKDFLEEYNLRLKIEAYVLSINKQIYKIEKKIASIKHSTDPQLEKARLNDIKSYEKSIAGLKELITKEYINAHIDTLYVKDVVKVLYSDFTNIELLTNKKITTRADYNKELNKATLNKIGVYIAISMLLGLSAIQLVTGDTISFVTNTIATLAMVVVRIVSALSVAPQIYDNSITKSYTDRANILKEYYAWRKTKPKESTEFQQELEKTKAELEQKYQEAFLKKVDDLEKSLT